MSYQPVIPFGGYAGWVVLQRTKDSQQEAFNASKTLQREVEYFRSNIAKAQTAETLVSDYRLLKVALGAFGLEEDINNKFFIQKVLEEGTFERDAFANKLSDGRYADLAEAFGFGNFDQPNTKLSYFSDDIIEKYQKKQFEVAVGQQNDDMRLALNINTALTEIATKDTTETGKWYSIMGNPAVRTVVQTALGLPSSISSLDLDQQLSSFQHKSRQYFGATDASQFADPEKREELVKLFLIRSDIASNSYGISGASNALALLSAGR